MSHKQAKGHRSQSRPAPPQRTPDELRRLLQEQFDALLVSSAAYDRGILSESKRLATTIRVLVYDTRNSISLLTQLGLKAHLALLDTVPPVDPRAIHSASTGLVLVGPKGYEPRFGRGRYAGTKPFAAWWDDPVLQLANGFSASRCAYILAAANKEGGAHVDPSLSELFAALATNEPLGWYAAPDGGAGVAMPGDVRLMSVRQIGYELTQTLRPIVEGH